MSDFLYHSPLMACIIAELTAIAVAIIGEYCARRCERKSEVANMYDGTMLSDLEDSKHDDQKIQSAHFIQDHEAAHECAGNVTMIDTETDTHFHACFDCFECYEDVYGATVQAVVMPDFDPAEEPLVIQETPIITLHPPSAA